MKTELVYLLLTAILTGVLWIPVVIGYVKTRGPLTDESYKVAPTSPLPPWVSRANRAHVNAVENFAPFAAVVLVANAAGISTSVTVACAAVYFYARLAHAIVHISGTGPAQGAHAPVHDRLDRLHHLRDRRAGRAM